MSATRHELSRVLLARQVRCDNCETWFLIPKNSTLWICEVCKKHNQTPKGTKHGRRDRQAATPRRRGAVGQGLKDVGDEAV